MPTVYPITSASEERIANKTWINGQILYQKDIKIDSVTGAVSFFDTEEEFDQLDQLYMIEGIGYISSINNYKTYNDKSSDINVVYDKDTAYIRIMIDSYSGYGTITDNTISFYYTKAEKARFRITNAGVYTPFYPVMGVNVNGESVLDGERVAQIKSYMELTQAEYDALPDTKRSDGIMYCIRDSAPSGEDQGIVDVQLNGVSVVDRYGIANLEGLASAMDLAAKQDLLVEGNNITMQRLADGTVRISAISGGGSGGGLTDVTVNGTSVVSGTVAIITIPTKTSDLTNDSNYITISVNNLTNYYTKTDSDARIDSKIAAIPDASTATKGLMTTTQVGQLDSALQDVKVNNVSVVNNNVANIDLSGKQNALNEGAGINIDSNTDTISVKPMTGASVSADGSLGGVPAPRITDKDKYLKGDGTWDVPPGGVYNDFVGATGAGTGTHGLVPAPAVSDIDKFLKSDGSWGVPNQDFVGATAQNAGVHGLVPLPYSTDREKFLKGDGTWTDVASALNELTDVDVSSVTDGQALIYNASNQEWIPGNVGYSHNYSTTEQIVGTWIDGKPLYEKSFEQSITLVNITSVTATVDIPTNINNFGDLVNIQGIMKCSNSVTSQIFPLYYNGDVNVQDKIEFRYLFTSDGATTLRFIIGSNFTSGWINPAILKVIIQYTKTTN